jgi:carbamoyltransferase
MGLAPYGNPASIQTKTFEKQILDELIDIKKDGSVLLNMDYFQFATGLRMCNEEKWEKLFGLAKREPETFITEPYMNLALAAQAVTEEVIFRLARTARDLTGRKKLVLAGGVALNCVANGKLLRSGIFEDLWIQPAAGDAGGALGAALAGWHIWKGREREAIKETDSMQGSFLGPQFTSRDVERVALKFDAPYEYYEKFDDLIAVVAKIISAGNVVGWFQGRMEYGPRALGNRSIVGDARHPEMQKKLNLKIKYREGFRPFAPSVLEEDIGDFFELDRPSPYMLLVAPVNEGRRNRLPENYETMPMFDRLYHLRSDVPAITHIDYSARIQSVSRQTNEKFWKLINEFKKQTGFGVIVNTSFNVRGEPIVCTPKDAYRCFMRTEMDYLVVDNFLFEKTKQKKFKEDEDWRSKYQLD